MPLVEYRPGAAFPGVTQYFEMLGHRSIYHDGGRAVCPWPGTSFAESGRQFGTPIPAATLTDLDVDHEAEIRMALARQ